jgi:hypothetical protein
VAWFVEQDRLFAVGDPRVVESDPDATASRLGEKEPVGKRLVGEEVPNGTGCEWSLLPRQSHAAQPPKTSNAERMSLSVSSAMVSASSSRAKWPVSSSMTVASGTSFR